MSVDVLIGVLALRLLRVHHTDGGAPPEVVASGSRS
jgi:hypothetical protein